jgi:hypothetical protein
MRSSPKLHVCSSSLSNLDDQKEDDLDARTKERENAGRKCITTAMCRFAYIIARKGENMVSHLPGDKMTRFKGQQRNYAEVHLR